MADAPAPSSPPAGQDLIAAVATPPGTGGVGVIRLSGRGAPDAAGSLFRSPHPHFSGLKPYRLHHGWLHAAPERGAPALDEVLLAFMPGPNSYTGEDVVEIHCHGGAAVLQALLQAVFAAGARPAGPGEFTKRAFLNGRMDLTQAEAVAELIASQSQAGLALASSRLQGDIGRAVSSMRKTLLEARAQLCLAVDFPEDDVECADPQQLDGLLASVQEQAHKLAAAGERTRPWREGVLTVLAGQVNAGKSSLFNTLLGRSRAIVADLPGTTRDYLEEAVVIRSIPMRLVDTAGLRDTGDIIEEEGMRISRDLVSQADIVVLAVDAGRTPLLDRPEQELLARLEPNRVVVAANKCDILSDDPLSRLGAADGWRVVLVSAHTGQGMEELMDAMAAAAGRGQPEPALGQAAPNARQTRLLKQAAEELAGLREELAQSTPYDVLSVRLDAAAASLADITGESTSDDVLNAIFDQFCIGK